MRNIIMAVSVIGLAACGQPAPDAEDTRALETDIETSTSEGAEPDSDIGLMPPAIEFAEDGDTIRASVGDEISVKLELPDSVGTSHMWQIQDNDWPEHLSWGNTWTSFEGQARYNDVIVNADAAGESELSFIRYADSEPTDDQVTVTVIVR